MGAVTPGRIGPQAARALVLLLAGTSAGAAEPLLDAQLATPAAAASPDVSPQRQGLHRHAWGLGFSAGGQTHPSDTYWVDPALGVANIELRLFPDPEQDLAMVIHGNWTQLLLSAVLYAPPKASLTMLAQGHPTGWSRNGRTALTMAAGGTLNAMHYDNPVHMSGEPIPDKLFVLGTAASFRIGVDIRSPDSTTRHGVYLRPEAGIVGRPGSPPWHWMAQFALVGEYVVTWAMGRR